MTTPPTPPAGAQALAELADTIERCRKEPSIAGLIAIKPDEADLIISALRALADMRGALTGLLQAVLEPVGEIERVKAAAVANDGKVPGRAAITLYATVEEYEAAMQRARQALARSAP